MKSNLRHWIVLGILVLPAVLGIVENRQRASVDRFYAAAQSAMAQNDFSQAEDLYNQAAQVPFVRIDSNENCSLYQVLGDCAMQQTHYESAESYYRKALSYATINTEAYVGRLIDLGNALSYEKKLTEADECFVKCWALTTKPSPVPADVRLVGILYSDNLLAQKRFVEAEAIAKAGLDWALQYRDNPSIPLYRSAIHYGYVLKLAGKLDEAKIWLEKAKAMRPATVPPPVQ